MDISLQKIDLVRERTGLSYADARELLEEAKGDVVDALIMLEDEMEDEDEGSFEFSDGDMLAPIKNAIRQTSRTRIRVKNQSGTLMELPATLGIAGMIFAPKATALSTAALLMANYSLEMTPAEPGEVVWDEN